jgi:cell division protein ZipA
MSELRWWLLILGVLFVTALTVWEMRRPRQARRGDAPPEPTRPREPALQLPEIHAREPLTSRTLPVLELPGETEELPVVLEVAAPRGDGAALDASADEGTQAQPEPEPEPEPDAAPELESEPEPQAEREPELRAMPPWQEAPADGSLEGATASAPPEIREVSELLVDWPPGAERRVMTLRLVAHQRERFAGRSLRQALAAEGFVLGRFDIFHKGDEARRAILSAASLTQPGTFDRATMDSQHFGGLSLFAVLPGPKSPPEAFEELVSTARSLNERLCGVLQDEAGTPLTAARIASLKARLNNGAPA